MDDASYKTPPEVARTWRCKPESVRALIQRGELAAVDLGTKSRPRYRISPDAIREFELRRSGKRPEKPRRKKRRSTLTFNRY